jgi:DNA polymerase (family 10)
MPSNAEAVAVFREIADLLDLLGERFKPEAYRRAARSIESLGEELKVVSDRGELDQIPGVGEAIGEKIREFLRDGRISYRDRLAAEVPSGLLELLSVEGLGPKTVRRFWLEAGINGPAELEAALDSGRLEGMKGFGSKKLAGIRAALKGAKPTVRTPLWEATVLARALVDGVRAAAPLDRIEVAGSYRRGRETIGDLDLLVSSTAPEKVFDAFGDLPEVARVVLRGDTKETVVLRNGLQVDLRVVPAASFGAALQYFTGSKDHNVRLRSRAQALGLKVNEYGVYRGDQPIAGASEAEVYKSLGLLEIPPELREDRGEIDASERRALPRLLTTSELLGDLHVHLPGKDPATELELLLRSALGVGHRYVGAVVPEDRIPSFRAVAPPAASIAGEGVRLYLGVERPLLGALPAPVPLGVEFLYEVPEPGAVPPPPEPSRTPGRRRAVVHLSTERGSSGEADPALANAWIRWAKAAGAALEIPPTASREGLDSASARMALEQEVGLMVTGLSRDRVDSQRLEVSVRLARRAGLAASAIWNSADRPFDPRAPRSTPTPRSLGTRQDGAPTPGRPKR